MSDPSQSAENNARAVAQERRAHPRYPFSAAAEAVHLHADTRLSGRVSDLGRGGCYVDTINPFPAGADVKIRITNNNESFVAQARVLYGTSGMGMALAFTKIEPEKVRVLEGWLAALSGESPRKPSLEDEAPPSAVERGGNEPRYVLNELILTLIRKQVLTDSEGKALLKKLMA